MPADRPTHRPAHRPARRPTYRPAFAPPLRSLLLVGVVAGLSAAATACGDAAPDARAGGAPGTTFTTAGDTTIARTSGLADRQPWAASLVEEVSIGAVDGAPEEIFGGISAVSALPDGGVYVWDHQAVELRRYGPDGAFAGIVGRAGEGPGEFQQVNGLRTLADGRTVVYDSRNVRLSLLDPEGGLITAQRGLSSLFGGPGVSLMASPDGGTAWVYARIRSAGTEQAQPGYIRHALDGPSTTDTVLAPPIEVDVYRTTVTNPEGNMRLGWQTPLAADLIWAVGPEGEVYGARSDEYRIDARRPDGTVLRIVTDAAPVPVPPVEREYQRERSLESARRFDPSWSWQGPPVPEVKPYFRSFYIGEGGRLWVLLHQPGEPTERENREGEMEEVWREPIAFDVFERDGTYLGAVRVPQGHRIAAMRGDTAWAIHVDDLGVQTLKRFRVEWPDIG